MPDRFAPVPPRRAPRRAPRRDPFAGVPLVKTAIDPLGYAARAGQALWGGISGGALRGVGAAGSFFTGKANPGDNSWANTFEEFGRTGRTNTGAAYEDLTSNFQNVGGGGWGGASGVNFERQAVRDPSLSGVSRAVNGYVAPVAAPVAAVGALYYGAPVAAGAATTGLGLAARGVMATPGVGAGLRWAGGLGSRFVPRWASGATGAAAAGTAAEGAAGAAAAGTAAEGAAGAATTGWKLRTAGKYGLGALVSIPVGSEAVNQYESARNYATGNGWRLTVDRDEEYARRMEDAADRVGRGGPVVPVVTGHTALGSPTDEVTGNTFSEFLKNLGAKFGDAKAKEWFDAQPPEMQQRYLRSVINEVYPFLNGKTGVEYADLVRQAQDGSGAFAYDKVQKILTDTPGGQSLIDRFAAAGGGMSGAFGAAFQAFQEMDPGSQALIAAGIGLPLVTGLSGMVGAASMPTLALSLLAGGTMIGLGVPEVGDWIKGWFSGGAAGRAPAANAPPGAAGAGGQAPAANAAAAPPELTAAQKATAARIAALTPEQRQAEVASLPALYRAALNPDDTGSGAAIARIAEMSGKSYSSLFPGAEAAARAAIAAKSLDDFASEMKAVGYTPEEIAATRTAVEGGP